jgi:hypothetical protein
MAGEKTMTVAWLHPMEVVAQTQTKPRSAYLKITATRVRMQQSLASIHARPFGNGVEIAFQS